MKDGMEKEIKELREGKTVICPMCKSARPVPVGNRETTRCFYCESETCRFKIVID